MDDDDWPIAPPPTRTTSYGADPAQVYDVRLPTDPGRRRDVTVIVVHGGFWRAMYDRSHAAPQAQGFADHGYHVAVVEYRRTGMPGGGWPGTFEDVTAAIAAARADPDLPDACVLVGHSAGGHLVTLAASQPWARGLLGAVSLAGCVDLVEGVRLGMGGSAVPDFLGAPPATDPESILAQADPAMLTPVAPVVLVHGTADDVVPIGVSQSYLAKIEAAPGSHAEITLVTLDGADHDDVIDPSTPAYATVLEQVGALG